MEKQKQNNAIEEFEENCETDKEIEYLTKDHLVTK